MSSKLQGDLTILASANAGHGSGKLLIQDDFNITAASGTKVIETTGASANLLVRSINTATLQSTAGAVGVSGQTGVSLTSGAGAATISGTSVGVTGAATFNSGTTFLAPLDVNSTSDFSDTVTLSKASGTGLSVTADTNVGGALGVTGAATFTAQSVHNGGVDVNGTADVSDTLTLSKASGTALSVAADALVTGVLTTTAQSVHNGGIDVNGVADVSDTLTLSKASGNALSVTADSAFTGTSTFTAQSIHNGGIDSNAASDFSETVTLSKATGIALAVTADSSFTGAATFTAQSVHNGGIDVNGLGDISDTLTLSKASGTGLSVTADASIGGTLGVTGVSTFTAQTVHNGGADINGTADVSDTLTVSKASGTGLSVTADATVGGTLTCNGLLVTGTTTTVNTASLTIADPIIEVNSTPLVGSDSGIVFNRFKDNVASDTPVHTTTPASAPGSGATAVTLATEHSASYDYTGGVLQLSESGNNEYFAVLTYVPATKVATVDTATAFAFTTAATVTLYDRPRAAFVFDESNDRFKATFTQSKAADSGIVTTQLASLEVDSIVASNVTFSGLSTTTVNVPGNTTSSAPVAISGLATRGSYTLYVVDQNAAGCAATIQISKGQATDSDGVVFAVTSSPATAGEAVNVVWPASAAPSLFFDPAGDATGRVLTVRAFGV